MRSCLSLDWKPGSPRILQQRENGRAGSALQRHSASEHSCGLLSNGVRDAFLYLQGNDFEFLALHDLRRRSTALRAAKQLHRAERALRLAAGAKDHDGNIFHEQERTL